MALMDDGDAEDDLGVVFALFLFSKSLSRN